MENNESLGTGLLVLVCAAGSALIGAIGGAIAMTTEKVVRLILISVVLMTK